MTDAKLVALIDRWLALPGQKARYSVEDENVLRYIRSQLTPEGRERRGEDDQDVAHLHEVARMRLAPYRQELDGSEGEHETAAT